MTLQGKDLDCAILITTVAEALNDTGRWSMVQAYAIDIMLQIYAVMMSNL